MKRIKLFYLFFCIGALPLHLSAQSDSSHKKSSDNYLSTRKGLFGKVVKILSTDTATPQVQRNDIRFQQYEGRVIRSIQIKGLNFGIPITDTNKTVTTSLTRLANHIHRKTRQYVIRNNLFFNKYDVIQPYLMADNERHLRDQPYLQDASILIDTLINSKDSVDVIVLVKDVFSIGGSISSLSLNTSEIAAQEDNLGGWGDGLVVRALYQNDRNTKFGYGVEYNKRNIAGTFIDGYAGYQNFYAGINGQKEENILYARFTKPLVNTYTNWTYSAEITQHITANMYSTDSVYNTDEKYKYYGFDTWAGYNFNLHNTKKRDEQRLRGLVALRLLNQKFQYVPIKFEGVYDWRYADLYGILGSISIFRQDFYKVQYIYGFGRNEDVPEGMNVALTAGWTKKQNRERPYLGIKFERYYFSAHKNYFNFTARAEGSLYKKNFEDITMLGNINYFHHLKSLGAWKQRTFLSTGVAWQANSLLNEPLMLESEFGLPEFSNGSLGGYFRATVKGESVFYTPAPASVASFRFAPFVFYNASLFTADNKSFAHNKLYTSLGAGLRTRNESLILGTLELRLYYFPRSNFDNKSFRIDINTNLKFKYNSQFINRPEFIQVN